MRSGDMAGTCCRLRADSKGCLELSAADHGADQLAQAKAEVIVPLVAGSRAPKWHGRRMCPSARWDGEGPDPELGVGDDHDGARPELVGDGINIADQ